MFDTADGIATICGDVIYDFNDQIVTPFHEIHDAEPRTTGNHGTSKRAEKAAIKKLLSSSRYLAAGPRPPGQDRGRHRGRPAARSGAGTGGSEPAPAQLVPGLSAERTDR